MPTHIHLQSSSKRSRGRPTPYPHHCRRRGRSTRTQGSPTSTLNSATRRWQLQPLHISLQSTMIAAAVPGAGTDPTTCAHLAAVLVHVQLMNYIFPAAVELQRPICWCGWFDGRSCMMPRWGSYILSTIISLAEVPTHARTCDSTFLS